jgi:excisionase family DNA binding protein
MNTENIQQDRGGERGARQRDSGGADGQPHNQVLTVEQAAELLHLHPVSVQRKARRGEIPAAKLGKRWIFLEIDLMACIRAQYPSRVMQGEHEEITICRSTNAKILPSIGSSYPTTEKSYREALGLPI